MKFSFVKKFKLFAIIALVIAIAGMVFLGVWGFNNTVDYKDAYELQVSINQYTPTSNTLEVSKDAINDYFKDNDLNSVDYAQTFEGVGVTFVYKFSKDVSVNVETLTQALQTALDTKAEVKGLTASVNCYKVSAVGTENLGFTILALAIALVLFFIYLLFVEKIKSALTLIISTVVSAILYLSVICLIRFPLNPLAGVGLAFAFVFASSLTSVLVNRFKENAKLFTDLSAEEIADKSVKSCIGGFVLILAILFIACLACVIFGPINLKLIAIKLFIGALVSEFASITFAPAILASLGKINK